MKYTKNNIKEKLFFVNTTPNIIFKIIISTLDKNDVNIYRDNDYITHYNINDALYFLNNKEWIVIREYLPWYNKLKAMFI